MIGDLKESDAASSGAAGGSTRHPGGMVLRPMLRQTAAVPGGSFVVAEWMDQGAGSSAAQPIAPLHIHHRDEEVWYVLEGALGFQLGDEKMEAPAGSAVLAPPGLPHSYWNAGPGPCRYLLIMTPRIHSLIQAIHALQDRNRESVAAVFRAHQSELL